MTILRHVLFGVAVHFGIGLADSLAAAGAFGRILWARHRAGWKVQAPVE